MRVETIGNAILYLGDCREILPTLSKVDLILTDPPFGIGNFVQTTGNVRGNRIDWNEAAPVAGLFSYLRTISKHRIIWGANFFNCFEDGGGAIIWNKNQPLPDLSKAEIASCTFYKKTEIVTITWTGGNGNSKSDHPCERPVRLYEWCINYIPDYHHTILDPFMGSGSTGVACANLGRKFTGIEIEPKYFDIACTRIEAAYAQGRLFA